MWLYPLPCVVALGGWLFVYASSKWLFIGIGFATLLAGVVAFLIWTKKQKTWPFAAGRPRLDFPPRRRG